MINKKKEKIILCFLVLLFIVYSPGQGMQTAGLNNKINQKLNTVNALVEEWVNFWNFSNYQSPEKIQPLTLKEHYNIALEKYKKNPNEKNIIWLGRRLAYLGKYDEAIEIFTKGIENFEHSYRLYRHRGHRHISTRQFHEAIADFEKAAELAKGKKLEVEEDGAPNAYNIPISNTHFNIYYHLGLAYYLTGNFKKAKTAYIECLKKWSPNNDCVIAATHWLYMTYRRLNEKKSAEKILKPISKGMKNFESEDYLNCLLVYKGVLKPEQVIDIKEEDSIGSAGALYGMGNWYFYNSNIKKAEQIFSAITRSKIKASFGYIAAEKDLESFK